MVFAKPFCHSTWIVWHVQLKRIRCGVEKVYFRYFLLKWSVFVTTSPKREKIWENIKSISTNLEYSCIQIPVFDQEIRFTGSLDFLLLIIGSCIRCSYNYTKQKRSPMVGMVPCSWWSYNFKIHLSFYCWGIRRALKSFANRVLAMFSGISHYFSQKGQSLFLQTSIHSASLFHVSSRSKNGFDS